jgi:hypothetical protein
MKSTKILTLNPIPSGVNQKLVPAKKYNELWDDVARIELKSYEPSIIVDKGLGDNTIQITGTSVATTLAGTNQLDSYCRVNLSDVLIAIHYTGSAPLIYYIKKQGDMNWNSANTIAGAYLDFTCQNQGPTVIHVKVGNGTIESDYLELTVNVTSNSGICAM